MREVDQALARAYSASRPSAADPGSPPSPHFAIEPAPGRPEPALGVSIEWPETVRALEREHGDRFDRLADVLVEVRDRRRLKTLLFTSCHRAEGRSTLVLTLARALSRRPGRTLIVDADVAGPMLAQHLGIRPIAGLDDVIESAHPLPDALLDAPDDHLTILPMRAPVSRPREFLASPAWSGLMSRLRREFDLVLIDGGPLFSGLSAAVLPRSVDAAVLVCHRGLTGERSLLKAQEVLEENGIPLLGLAETFV